MKINMGNVQIRSGFEPEEKELLELRAKMEAISKAQAVIEFNLDGTIITANENFLSTLGYTLTEIQGQHHRMFVEPEYKVSQEYQHFWERLNRGEYETAEYKRIGKGGKEVWIQASYNPVFDMDGKPIKVVKFATDITASKLKNADVAGQLKAISKAQAVIEFNLDGTIITANENFLNTVGYTLAEIQGQHHSMFVEPGYKASQDYQQFWERLNRGEYESAEYKRIGKGGKEVWIQASYNPIFDMDGIPFKVVKFASDITAIKLRDADVTGQIDAISKAQAVIEFNLDGTIITANENFLSTVGYTLAEIQGQHHSMFVEPEYKASQDYQQFWERLNRGEYESAEYKRIGKGGKEVWIQASYNPIFDMNGKPFKVVKFANDVTVNKLNNANFSGQIDAISKAQAVIEFNLDGTIITANDNFLATLGYTLDEIQGQHHSMFVEPEYKFSADYQQFWAKLNRGEYESAEYKRIAKGGKEIWIQASYNPIIDLNGKPFKVVKFATDITDQKNLAAENRKVADISSALKLCNTSVMLANADMNIVYINDEASKLMVDRENEIRSVVQGFEAGKVIGRSIGEFLSIPSNGIIDTQIEISNLTFGIVATPWNNVDGERIGTVVEWKDLTASLEKQREDERIANESLAVKNALEVCSTSVMMADADYNIMFMNSSVTEMMTSVEKEVKEVLPNFNASTLMGTNIDVFHKDPSHQRNMLDRLTNTYQTQIEVGALTIEIIATPVLNAAGERINTVVEWKDLTASLAKQREEQRISNEAMAIKNALEVCNTSVMMADADYNIMYMNGAVDRMMSNAEADIRTALPNFDARNLIGSNIDVFHKDPSHQRRMLDGLKDTYSANINVGPRIMKVTATPVFSAEGERLNTVVEWEDLTEALAKQQADEALSAENARIKQALDNVTANVMVADANLNIIYMNDAVVGMMRNAESDIRTDLPQFSVDTLDGANIDIFHKNPAHQRGLLERQSAKLDSEFILGGRTLRVIANVIKDSSGDRLGTVVEWMDRTEEVAIQKEIDNIVSSASMGDLSARVDESNKKGFFKNVSTGLNNLVGVCEAVLADLGGVLGAMAKGDLTKQMSGEYEGDFAGLKDNANKTIDQLTSIIGEINEASIQVLSGSEEIAAGNTDLSQRTEEQASSLEETAASMEEMTSSVRQSSDNVKRANELAINTQSKAEEGGAVVAQAVDAMDKIRDSSKKIADIIGVIDEIAFQTNLLALNAAVEAARAGEQGRGFAVVAGEVRNLAQRSAAAAKDIKDLINDSVAKVGDGTMLVGRSGDTLAEIVKSVQQVGKLIGEVTTSAEEQSSGIEQVNQAVSQMDEMTQQNAALVEEASAASEAMSDQAKQLGQLVSFFNTSSSGGSAGGSVALVSSRSTAVKQLPKAVVARTAPSTGFDAADEWEEF